MQEQQRRTEAVSLEPISCSLGALSMDERNLGAMALDFGAGAFRGAQAAAAAVRELPGTLAKHAVAPGVAVQALEEALPDSKHWPPGHQAARPSREGSGQ